MFKILMVLDHTTLYMSLPDLQQFPFRLFAAMDGNPSKIEVVSQNLGFGSGSVRVTPYNPA